MVMVEGEERGGEKGGPSSSILFRPLASLILSPALHPALPHSNVHTSHQTLFTSLRIYIFRKEFHVKLYEIMSMLCERCRERMVILMKGRDLNLDCRQ